MKKENLTPPTNFIRQIVEKDLAEQKNDGRVQTRFPPEPNGYLHIGHAKSICLNFGLANSYDGQCNLRFDDTNPEKESVEYIESIKRDVQWLGFEWAGDIRYASAYFDALYAFAVELIKRGKAYVCQLNAEQMREYRGTLTTPGKNSPYRDRSVEENLALFDQMKQGVFKEGEYTLRAKIDMASPNMNMRDPIIYRIRFAHHHQTGDKWCIYPMYDFTHCLSDMLENITHSICTLEFADHKALYDWVLDALETPCHPVQIEFSRLSLEYTVMSKRKLNALVTEGYVDGWNDPRMPTISGLRRRGYTPASIREFCERIGVTRQDNRIEMGVLESCIREDLENTAPRAMAVLNPLKVVIVNYPEGQVEQLTAKAHPNIEEMGERTLPFSREIYIDRSDFEEIPPKKYKRLTPDNEVRLRNAYVIKCEDIVKNEAGEIVELHCSYDVDTLGKNPEGRKVKGVIHWVSCAHAIEAEVRLYDRLFAVANPDAAESFESVLNADSLQVLSPCYLEPGLVNAQAEVAYQFEREGYFCLDSVAAAQGKQVFNRTVTLRDGWGKIQNKG